METTDKCFTPGCAICSSFSRRCLECLSGYGLKNHVTVSKAIYGECIQVTVGCLEVAESGLQCNECESGYQRELLYENTYACVSNLNKNFYLYLGIYLAVTIGLFAYGAWFFWRRAIVKKKREEVAIFMKANTFDGFNEPTSTFRNLKAGEDILTAKKETHTPRPKPMITEFQEGPRGNIFKVRIFDPDEEVT